MENYSKEEKQKILRRLKKILALSQSSEPGEAAAALHQAEVLMRKFGLSSLDVEIEAIEESEVTLTSADLTRWENALIGIVASSIGITVLIKHVKKEKAEPGVTYYGKRPKASVIFIGESIKTKIAVYALETLRRNMRREMKIAIDELLLRVLPDENQRKAFKFTPKQRESYAFTWCQAVRSKVQALAPGEEFKTPEAVTRYIEARMKVAEGSANPKESSRKNQKSDPISLYMQRKGFSDGKNTPLHQAVNGKKVDLLS